MTKLLCKIGEQYSIKRQNRAWLSNLEQDSPYQLTAQLFPFGSRPWQQCAPCTVPQLATVSSTGLLQSTFAPPREWEAFQGTCGGETISIGGAILTWVNTATNKFLWSCHTYTANIYMKTSLKMLILQLRTYSWLSPNIKLAITELANFEWTNEGFTLNKWK